MGKKKPILVITTRIIFIILLILLYLDRLDVDGNIVFKTIQEFDTRLLLLINPDGHVFFLNAMFLFITDYLNTIVPVTLILLFLLSFKIERLVKYRFILLVLFISFLLTAFATLELKDLYARARPQMFVSGPYYFGDINPLSILEGHTSFPSGHTSTAFSLVVPLLLYLRTRWLKILLFTYACLQGISRMWVGVHFPSDVLMGAILAIIVGVSIFYIFRRVIAEIDPADLRIENEK